MSPRQRPERLRVLTMCDSIGVFGGAEELARQVAVRLDPQRFESIFCVTRWSPDPRSEAVRRELEETGTGFIGLQRKGRLDVAPWRSLITQMRERRVDVLHTHKVGSNLWGAILAPRVPVDVFVAHEHSWAWKGRPYRKFVDRHLIARRADAVVAVSESDRRAMIEIERTPPEKTRLIPNGIPVPTASRSGAEVRAELGIGPEVPVAGMVATIRPEKAYDVLIRAAAVVRREVPGARVLIVGGAESPRADLRPGLERLIEELGLGDTVMMLGARDDAFDVMGAFDVAALSSDREGSPISILEYMQAAKPVVATRVGGIPDQVVEGETGLLVPPQDPEALGKALVELLTDPERARRMGAAGRDRRAAEFSMEATIRRVEGLYDELYAEAGR